VAHSTSSNGEVHRSIRALFDVGRVAGLGDGALLDRFLHRGGETAELAFSALVERHGPMVLRVCRRILADPQDAEDAFQAVFLVLARRAGSIRRRESIASWLHGAAVRVASAARGARRRRRFHERRAAGRAAVVIEDRGGDAGGESGRLLHEEIGRMSEPFRSVVVLCGLQGRSYHEAARLLGCPVGTIKSRLATAREKLRLRLDRRGLGPAGFLAGTLAAEAATAAVPRGLAAAVVRHASWRAAPGSIVALTEGVLKAMGVTRLSMAAVSLLAVGLGVSTVGVGVLAQQEPGPNLPQVETRNVFGFRFEGHDHRPSAVHPRDQTPLTASRSAPWPARGSGDTPA
jgi:RNA polymerase sigma factor (sigma-70 family)